MRLTVNRLFVGESYLSSEIFTGGESFHNNRRTTGNVPPEPSTHQTKIRYLGFVLMEMRSSFDIFVRFYELQLAGVAAAPVATAGSLRCIGKGHPFSPWPGADKQAV